MYGHIETKRGGMEKDIPCKINQKKSEIAISDKTGLKSKTVLRDKEGPYIMIKN